MNCNNEFDMRKNVVGITPLQDGVFVFEMAKREGFGASFRLEDILKFSGDASKVQKMRRDITVGDRVRLTIAICLSKAAEWIYPKQLASES